MNKKGWIKSNLKSSKNIKSSAKTTRMLLKRKRKTRRGKEVQKEEEKRKDKELPKRRDLKSAEGPEIVLTEEVRKAIAQEEIEKGTGTMIEAPEREVGPEVRKEEGARTGEEMMRIEQENLRLRDQKKAPITSKRNHLTKSSRRGN